jgi:hypothetical protein
MGIVKMDPPLPINPKEIPTKTKSINPAIITRQSCELKPD